MINHNDYINKYILKIKQQIKNEIIDFINQSNNEFNSSYFNIFIERLNYINNKNDIDNLYSEVKSEILNSMKSNLKTKLYDLNISFDDRFDIQNKIHNAKSLDELKKIEQEFIAKNKDNIDDFNKMKNEILNLLNSLKNKYKDQLFERNLDIYKDDILNCTNTIELQSMFKIIQIELISKEQEILLNMLDNDTLKNNELFAIANKYRMKLYDVKTLNDVIKLKNEYINEKNDILNVDMKDNNKSR
jgi:hypothetical protein